MSLVSLLLRSVCLLHAQNTTEGPTANGQQQQPQGGAAAVLSRGLTSSMLLDDGSMLSAAELAAMRAEVEAYKVGGVMDRLS